eukprot:15498735-Heterocapsa_arctica.AAC.1
MRALEGGWLGDRCGQPGGRMQAEDLYNLLGKGKYLWVQEGGLRDQQKHHIGAMEGDASGSPVQELDYPGEDRQDECLHGIYVKAGAQHIEQIGGSPLIAQGRHQIIELVGVHTELSLGHDHLIKCGTQGVPGIPRIRGNGQQGICHGTGVVHPRPRCEVAQRGQEGRCGG